MPPSKDICIKMGIFCHMRRTKRDLLGRGGRKGVKGTQIKTEKVRDRRLNYTLESFIGKEGHIFFYFTFLLGLAATFITESGVDFVCWFNY